MQRLTLGNPAGVAQLREKCTLEHHERPAPSQHRFHSLGSHLGSLSLIFRRRPKASCCLRQRELPFQAGGEGCELLGT